MKKHLIFLACATMLLACSNDSVTITGTLENLPEGSTVKLTPSATHQQEDPIAEAVVLNGKFKIELSLEEPRVFYLACDSVRGSIMYLMAEPGDKIKITGTLAEPVVTGSKIHEEFIQKFLIPREDMNRRYAELNEMRRNIWGGRRGGIDTTSEEYKAYGQAEMAFLDYVHEVIEKATTENANTFWGPLLQMQHTTFLEPDQERLYKMFSEEAKNSFYGKAMALELYGVPVGQPAPAFTAKDADGKEYSLKNLLNGDKYILIDFWASWCGPCRKFVPTLKELAVKYADEMTVIAISTDTDHNAWLKALEQEQKPWLNLLDESNIGKNYVVSAIPSFFLLDPQGKIVFGKQGGQGVIDKLAEVFGK